RALGEVDAPDKQAALKRAAEVFDIPVERRKHALELRHEGRCVAADARVSQRSTLGAGGFLGGNASASRVDTASVRIRNTQRYTPTRGQRGSRVSRCPLAPARRCDVLEGERRRGVLDIL